MFQRRISDLVAAVRRSGAPRFTMFCNDREQELARAALSSAGFFDFVWDGGYEGAQRCILCLFDGKRVPAPLCCLRISIADSASSVLTHRDYLGALMGLRISRECIGDIVCRSDGAQVVVTRTASSVILEELHEVGRCSAHVERIECMDPVSHEAKKEQTVTLASLRLDALLSAMLHVSRSQASKLIVSGAVQINHVPKASPGEAVFEEDVFSVRGYGKFKLKQIGAKSRKDRIFVTFQEY